MPPNPSRVLLRPLTAALVAALLASACFIAVLTLGAGTATAEGAHVAARLDCSAAEKDLADARSAVASDRRLVTRWKRSLRRADTAAEERRAARKLTMARRSLRLQVEWRDDAQRTYDDCLAGTPSPTSPTSTPTAPTSTPTTTAPSPSPTATTSPPLLPCTLPLICP